MKPWYYVVLTILALVLPGIATVAIIVYTIWLLIEQKRISEKIKSKGKTEVRS